jgi:cytoskeletal protein RodZ
VSNLSSEQLEQLQEIGAYLYQTRRQLAKPLEEVAATTFIPLRLLKAIEAGQAEVLPEPVFIQGFIRRFADALGLNGVVLAQKFTIASPIASYTTNLSASASRPLETPEPIKPISVKPDKYARDKYAKSDDALTSPSKGRAGYIAASILGIAIIGSLAYGASRSNLFKTTDPGPKSATTKSTQSSTQASASPIAHSTSQAQAATSPTVLKTPIKVEVELTGDSWLRVISDNKTIYEGILTQGNRGTWTAKESLTVLAGNAGVVSLSYNDGPAQVMGKRGAVERMTFPAKSSPQPKKP